MGVIDGAKSPATRPQRRRLCFGSVALVAFMLIVFTTLGPSDDGPIVDHQQSAGVISSASGNPPDTQAALLPDSDVAGSGGDAVVAADAGSSVAPAVTSPSGPSGVPAIRGRVDVGGRSYQMALENYSSLYHANFGRWNTSCECSQKCLDAGDAEAASLGDASQWAPEVLKDFFGQMFEPWRAQKITLHDHVSMAACSYRTRMHYNPTGVWLHINGNNATSLRVMQDGYKRQERIERYIKQLVARADPPLPRMVIYVSTTDVPCNPTLPYLGFFGKRGVRSLIIPDDTFIGGGAQRSWSDVAEQLGEASRGVDFGNRRPTVFFRGSPTHGLRVKLRDALQECCDSRTNITLAVMEKFKHLMVPLREHVKYRYLLAVRGRTASSRDKYLNLLNSTILWGTEDDDGAKDDDGDGDQHQPQASSSSPDDDAVEEKKRRQQQKEEQKRRKQKEGDREPWFQWYHALWKPYVNYVPLRPKAAKCTLDLLDANPAAAARIAARGAELGRFLSQDVVDDVLLGVLREYAALQTYKVEEDPIDFLRHMYSFVKRHYRNAQLMPDDRYPTKFYFASWVKRRVRQLMACRKNATQTFSYHNQGGCWYT